MSTYLIDYENVQAGAPLCGIDRLSSSDEVFLFYSDSANKMKEYYWQLFNGSRCKTHVVKLKHKGPNALDFYISVQVGICIGQRINNIAVVSNDKDFYAVEEYSESVLCGSAQNVICASCIEEARRIFENEKRKQKKILNLLKKTITIKEPGECKISVENECSDSSKSRMTKGNLKQKIFSNHINFVNHKFYSNTFINHNTITTLLKCKRK